MPHADYFKEVRELLKELTESQKKTDEAIKETQQQIKETQQEIKDTQQEVKDTQQEVKDTQKTLKTLQREVTKIVGGWGMFVEGLVAPGIPKLLKKCDINLKTISLNVESRLDGRCMEIDVLGIGTRNGKGIVVACSIKSRLQADDIDDFIDRLDSFFDFFPEYANRKLIGLVGGIRIDEGVDRYAQRRGFYVIGSSGEVVKLLNKKDFKPKVWG